MSILYFTRPEFIEACQVADLTKRNRRIAWEDLPTDAENFPVVFSVPHNDVEMRVQVICDAEGTTAYLDIPFKTFDALHVDEDTDED
jgi:FixJ family two-component response regulator|tara:strand:- start:326 stop:586 length:261 start_codon:yes stop_codon:yes gene_type:complete